MVDKQLGEAQNKLEGFNDDLSVQTEAVATLTAVSSTTRSRRTSSTWSRKMPLDWA